MKDRTERVKCAIDEMFRDTSVSQAETAGDLQDIIEHCEVLMKSLDD